MVLSRSPGDNLTMAMTFFEMLKTQNIGEITRSDLRPLSLDQLEAFARLLGIPYSGRKAKRVQRIFDALSVRYFLVESEDIHAASWSNTSRKRASTSVPPITAWRSDFLTGESNAGEKVKNFTTKCAPKPRCTRNRSNYFNFSEAHKMQKLLTNSERSTLSFNLRLS